MTNEEKTLSTGTRGRIGSIDGLRAFAMLMVYTYHAWLAGGTPSLSVPLGSHSVSFGSLLSGFPAGVDLFMVLSGFCLFWPLAKNPAAANGWSPAIFGWRRIRRIVPPYYAAILYVTLLPNALVVLYRLLGQQAKWQPMAEGWHYVTHLLFLHTLFPASWASIQGAFWSLGLEAQFYLAFPLVVAGYARLGIRVVWFMAGASILYRIGAILYTQSSPWDVQFVASVFFLGRWMQFGAGMLAAWAVARGLPARLSGGWAGTGMLSLALAAYFSGLANAAHFSPLRDLLLAAGFGAGIVALCGTATPFRHLFDNRVARGLGVISYSVFLIHQNTLFYLSELFKKVLHLEGPSRFALLMTLGLAFILGLALIFFRFFERPFLQPVHTRSIPEQPTPDLCLITT